MALADLLRTLEEDAAARREALLARAKADAEGLRAESGADLARRRAAALAAREAELRATAARATEVARRQAARRWLESRSATHERIRRRAETRLAEQASDPGWLPSLAHDVVLALEYMGSAPSIIEAPVPLLEYLRGTIAGLAQVTLEAAGDGDGRRSLLVRSADGSLTVDATLESRLARAWPRLAIDLAARLEALP
jgi:vacuolar-type H+-ATPase subunit E/Vma4